MKIPFDIKYRPQIESGEYKVIDKDNHNVRIICWDKKSEKKYGYHIVGLVEFGPQHEESTYYTIDGKGRLKDKEPELFILTDEPELTKFQQAIYDLCPVLGIEEAKATASNILKLAKKELCKDCRVSLDSYARGRLDEIYKREKEGPDIQTYFPPCFLGGPCTNPMGDCINCPRQSTIGINTTTGTSSNLKAQNNE